MAFLFKSCFPGFNLFILMDYPDLLLDKSLKSCYIY